MHLLLMTPVQIALGISILALFFSLGVPVLLARRQGELFQMNLAQAIDYTREVHELVEKEIPNIKRAHSIMGTIGNETREVRKAEKALELDLMSNQLGIDVNQGIELLKEISPRAGEMVEKNPDLLTQLAPRIIKYVEMHKGEEKPRQTTFKGPSKAWE